MDIRITPSKLNGNVDIIPSKSDVHRLLICAALSNAETTVCFKGKPSRDVEATAECLAKTQCVVLCNSDGITLNQRTMQSNYVLNCAESGSTARFLLPVAAALGKPFTMTGSGRLPERPMAILTELLRSHGCTVSSDRLPLSVSGQLTHGIFRLLGNVSSQYISGLLFALPLLSGDSELIIEGALESAAYVDMTLSALVQFGVTVKKTESRYCVEGGQKYKSLGTVTAEGDWSNAAFWLAAGSAGDIVCQGLDKKSLQADKAIVSVLERMGAVVMQKDGKVSVSDVKADGLRAVDIDISAMPDLAPVIAVLMSVAKGTSSLFNAARLRLKESDRLSSVYAMINALGGQAEEGSDFLKIKGKQHLSGGTVDSFNDHRIVMAAAVASVFCKREIIIKNAEAVEKSYPDFFEVFKSLGGRADVI